MPRSLALLLLVFCIVPIANADDATPTEAVLTHVKRATVFVQVQTGTSKGSGSGFVVSVNKDVAFIATNYHVVAGANFEKKPKPTPSEVVRFLKEPTINVVFDSGTKTERSMKATAIAGDPANDLAILRVEGLKDPPAAIDWANSPKLIETMPVFSFGFPFGQSLALGKGSPAITVGKASISSIRQDDNGDLNVVQIDGNINPGNSGGPIVDVKGRLVGVAVATIRGSGIGMAVPGIELGKVMKGRLGTLHLVSEKGADGKVTIRAEVGLIDPAKAIGEINLYYLAIGADGKKPAPADRLEKLTGVTKLALKVVDGIATGEFILDQPKGELIAQVIPAGNLEIAKLFATRSLNLSGLRNAADIESEKPPEGWQEYTPKPFRAFTVWIPEKTVAKAEQDRTSLVRGLRLRTIALHVEVAGGVHYDAERIVIPTSVKLNRKELEEALLDISIAEIKGRVKDSNDVKLRGIPGKETLIESASSAIRVRVFVGVRGVVFIFKAKGPKAQIEKMDTQIFLDSCRFPTTPPKDDTETPVPKVDPPVVTGPKVEGDRTAILGFAFGTEFSDAVPEGAMLVGLEIGLGKFFNNDVIKSAQPIFRNGEKETSGELHGLKVDKVVKIVAKPGYVIGAVTAKSGLGIDGLSVTFVKFADGKLDMTDKYESDWVGGMGGGGPNTVRSDGRPIVALLGRTNKKNEFIAIGFLMQAQKK